jgi:hypothetical protein
MDYWSVQVKGSEGEFTRYFRVMAPTPEQAVYELYPEDCLSHLGINPPWFRLRSGSSATFDIMVKPWDDKYMLLGDTHDVVKYSLVRPW